MQRSNFQVLGSIGKLFQIFFFYIIFKNKHPIFPDFVFNAIKKPWHIFQGTVEETIKSMPFK